MEKSERKGKMKYKSNMQIVGPSIKSNFKGSFENKRYKVFATKIDLDYNIDRWVWNDMKFRSKIKNLSTKSLKKIKGDA